jgi:hypothetical protein
LDKVYQEIPQKIYRILFHQEIPSLLKERYHRLLEKLLSTFPEADRIQNLRILARIRDWESLELAARLRHKMPFLVLCFQLMVRLGETLPQNRRFYINHRDRRAAALLSLMWGGLRTFWKFIKGNFLLWRIKDV